MFHHTFVYHISFFIEGEDKSRGNSFTRKVCPRGLTLLGPNDKWFSPIGNLLLFYINVSFRSWCHKRGWGKHQITARMLIYLPSSWSLLDGLFQITNRVSAQIVHLSHKMGYQN